jgi:hypothetical protein
MSPGETQTRETAAKARENVACPLPLDGYIPDRETGRTEDVHTSTEDDGLPSGAFEDAVARPCIQECGDDLYSVGRCWVLSIASALFSNRL